MDIEDSRREAGGQRREIYSKISDSVERFCQPDFFFQVGRNGPNRRNGLRERRFNQAVGFILLGVLYRL